MAQGKCSLLKPVNSLTGSFFTFSQYAQDLTKQYANCDAYRCVPSKFVAMNLDYSAGIPNGSSTADMAKQLGEKFQNYFENACTFLRGEYSANNKDWDPEYTRTLLFQTLEKYGYLNINPNNTLLQQLRDIVTDEDTPISGISDCIQYIGDINIYSYDDNAGGVGYNEIYCYIPNEAKCMDYRMCSVESESGYVYDGNDICGYEDASDPLYNGLSPRVAGYTDIDANEKKCYAIGKYDNGLDQQTMVPQCLLPNDDSDDQPRQNDGRELDKFDINTILVLYDIVSKTDDGGSVTVYQNIPLGIYFCGALDEQGVMSNTITKYVYADPIYNQGTSYGLRVCTRFFTNANSTEIIDNTVTGSSNIAEMAPVLEKMGEVVAEAQAVVNSNADMQTMIQEHLDMFKNNKVNVPYVRTLGTRKYWFVNGKNTGAIAQYEESSPESIITDTLNLVSQSYYSKEEISSILADYVRQEDLSAALNQYATKEYVDEKIAELENKLRVWLQGESDE